eukprot:Gb_16034 [translate_table: standard]
MGFAAPSSKSKSKDNKEPKKERMSIFAMLANMDNKFENPISDGLDLLPSNEEDESDGDGAANVKRGGDARGSKPLEVSLTNKELKSREKKDQLVARVVEIAKEEAMKDDRDAFAIVINSCSLVLKGEDTIDANIKPHISTNVKCTIKVSRQKHHEGVFIDLLTQSPLRMHKCSFLS